MFRLRGEVRRLHSQRRFPIGQRVGGKQIQKREASKAPVKANGSAKTEWLKRTNEA